MTKIARLFVTVCFFTSPAFSQSATAAKAQQPSPQASANGPASPFRYPDHAVGRVKRDLVIYKEPAVYTKQPDLSACRGNPACVQWKSIYSAAPAAGTATKGDRLIREDVIAFPDRVRGQNDGSTRLETWYSVRGRFSGFVLNTEWSEAVEEVLTIDSIVGTSIDDFQTPADRVTDTYKDGEKIYWYRGLCKDDDGVLQEFIYRRAQEASNRWFTLRVAKGGKIGAASGPSCSE